MRAFAQLHGRALRQLTVAVLAAGAGLAPLGAAAQAWSPGPALEAARSVGVAVDDVLEALRIVVIPAHMPYRARMLGDVVQDAQEIQRASRYLVKLLDEGKGYQDTDHQVRRISRNFEDLADNAQMLAPPEQFRETVATLREAVGQLKEVYAAGG